MHIRPGKLHTLADQLSRISTSTTKDGIDELPDVELFLAQPISDQWCTDIYNY